VFAKMPPTRTGTVTRRVRGSSSVSANGFTGLTGTKSIPLAYFVLQADGEGPVIGYLDGRPIPATVVDRDGLRYSYAGLAPRWRDGRLNVDSLGPNAWIVAPGFIYLLQGSASVP
jgi:hypothetical protein